MDASTSCKRAKTTAAAASGSGTPQKNAAAATLFADQVVTPEKQTQKVGAKADLIRTPEKMEHRPLLRGAAGNGAVAFSVKKIRRKALVLRRADKRRAEVAGEDKLESVERDVGVGDGAGCSPEKSRPEVKLPESYTVLCEFFTCFLCSIRLLRANGCRTTFPNICACFQKLAHRRFEYKILAQLKYIIPEAIVINKILLPDENTCCMKPDLQVTLLVDEVEGTVMQKGETGYSALRKIFRQRLVDFFRNHPEGDDIPEHELPFPFTQSRPKVAQITPRVDADAKSVLRSPPSLAEQQPVWVSHVSPSFKRLFSLRSSTCLATGSSTHLVDCTKWRCSLLPGCSTKSDRESTHVVD